MNKRDNIFLIALSAFALGVSIFLVVYGIVTFLQIPILILRHI